MPLISGSSNKAFENNVAEMVKAGHPLNQALAAAYSKQRKSSDSEVQPVYEVVKELMTAITALLRVVGQRTKYIDEFSSAW